jgi:CubicO group peptidase (beta-lactamase class C family)
VFHADMKTILAMPLVNQPGETWEYGINVDWAGIMLERATGVRLNDLIQRDICRPLGLHALSLLPGPEMVAKLAHMHQRWPGNSHIETRDHLYREPLLAANDTDKDRLFHSGGAGGFATPANFVQVLAVLLNNGEHSRTGARILKPETVDLMFENQIPHLPDFARAPSPASKPEITNASQETYPQGRSALSALALSFVTTMVLH